VEVTHFIVLPLMGQGMHVDSDWGSFRTLTFICLPIMVLGGILTPIIIGRGIEAMGVTERIVAYTFYFWLFVLAYQLINDAS
jgi:hypothetical protein